MSDPWSVLGLSPDATIEQARAARRRLARDVHPDRHAGGSAAELSRASRRMAAVNEALARLEAAVSSTGRGNGDDPHPQAWVVDGESFAVGALPVEALEALFIVGYGLGDVLVIEEPYALQLYLDEPWPCFCDLTLAPEAGASLVTVDVSGATGDREPPSPGAVCDLLVGELNRLAGR